MEESSENKASGETETEELRIAISHAIQAMSKQFGVDGTEVKGSVADLIKLLQLRKELEAARPRHVSARWIDECEMNSID